MHSLLCSIRESIHFSAFIQLAQFFETLRIVKLYIFTLQVQTSPDRDNSSKPRETMQACHIIYAYLSQFFVIAEHALYKKLTFKIFHTWKFISLSCSSFIMDACISKVSKM